MTNLPDSAAPATVEVLCVVACSRCGDVARVDTEGRALELADEHAEKHDMDDLRSHDG